MSEKTVRTVRLVYGCVLSFLLVLTGACFIHAALSIYYGGGESPYTPEAIAARFEAIVLPVILTLALILGGILLALLLPEGTARPRAIPHRRAFLLRLEKRKDTSDEAYRAVAAAESRRRLLVRVAAAVVSLLASVPALLHLFSEDAFRYPEYNASVIGAMPTLLLFSAVLTALLTLCALLCDRSYARQTKALAAAPTRSAPTEEKSSRATLLVRLGILAVALLFLVLGIVGGGMADVLSKAINICTECIGLG